MTRLFRLPVLAAPALAATLGAATLGIATPVMALAQDASQPSSAQTAPASPPAAAPDASASNAPAPGAPAPDAGAPPAGQTPAPSGDAGSAPAPSSTPAPDAAPPAAPAPQTAASSNPYGLAALWVNGDIIDRGVLLILVIMSVGTWLIMILKFFEQGRVFSASKEAAAKFWNKSSVQEGASSLKESSPFRYVAETGIVAAEHHEGSMRDAIDLHSWTAMSIDRSVATINTRLQGGLAFLGTVGSTSPFVGLFGTVWGIYHALTAIAIAGQPSIDKIAGPVGAALINTAIGLAVAVPAVLGYNLLVRRNKGAMDRVRNFAADVQSVLIGGFRHGVAPDEGRMDVPVTTTTSQRIA
ncbi:MotA/TolQ/ExbB proton channel family protein [Tanticharoenia sakaeratensis]|uniref:Biopolymer transport protein ExbB n=1 Tax=Tanticharoenia sakaeratensis NBRC 103193 TaxID=1231623 RepID=A0A0D6MGT7_9PROT|nr:MotA/TolQ/ExbB proton channel family protein [Tanticharoenia sakaeratensis]GAN52822.1 biopolymer transport ExbB protein [Tanticharoenia sakaeratensis NBRC 103193]GBQ18117.1 ExbB/TolQ/MotA proton channel family protein [Tanticharoenia sakaeratensis NBRC 103193]